MIYVDDMRLRVRVGRLKARWSHLFAFPRDTAKLLEFGLKIGLRREWLQAAGTPDVHFDVTDDIRRRAIQAGAMPITVRQAVLLRRQARGPPSVGVGSGGMT